MTCDACPHVSDSSADLRLLAKDGMRLLDLKQFHEVLRANTKYKAVLSRWENPSCDPVTCRGDAMRPPESSDGATDDACKRAAGQRGENKSPVF